MPTPENNMGRDVVWYRLYFWSRSYFFVSVFC